MMSCAGLSSVIAACRDGATMPTDNANAVTVTRDEIVVRLNQLAALQTPNSMHVLGEQQVAILRVGEADYRAFTNVCTHAGCGIYIFAGQRLRCQCHGSEFDVNGTNVAGPAPSPLRRYAVTFNSSARELRIALG